jgi:hypothetical protein
MDIKISLNALKVRQEIILDVLPLIQYSVTDMSYIFLIIFIF